MGMLTAQTTMCSDVVLESAVYSDSHARTWSWTQGPQDLDSALYDSIN